MRQTLLSRWQGALLGSFLGAIFGAHEEAELKSWREIQEEGIKSLTETGEWKPRLKSHNINPAEMLVQCLPLILFFHDQEEELKERLRAIAQLPKKSAETMEAIEIYATVMSWILKEQIRGKNWFEDLKIDEWLQTLQTQRNKGSSLEETQAELSGACQDIGLALYCFGITSEDLRLSVGRVKTIKGTNPWVFPLVGALSGAHNGMVGFPLSWRLLLHKQKREEERKLILMLGTWSGSYKFAKINQPLKKGTLTGRVKGTAIASLGVIQRR